MRGGGGRRYYGGRGSGRGSGGQFRSSKASRMENSNRRGGGSDGNRFDFYNENRTGNNYSNYDKRNDSPERNSRARDRSTNRRDGATSHQSYRTAQRERSYDGNKRHRENEQRRSSTTRRGNRTPPPPPPPPPPRQSPMSSAVHSMYRGSASNNHSSHVNKTVSKHRQQMHHHDTHNNRSTADRTGRTYRSGTRIANTHTPSARARLSLKTSDLRNLRRKAIYTIKQKEVARARKLRITSQLQRRRRLQRSKSVDVSRNATRSSDSKKDAEKSDKEMSRKRKASTPTKRGGAKVRMSISPIREPGRNEKRSGNESDANNKLERKQDKHATNDKDTKKDKAKQAENGTGKNDKNENESNKKTTDESADEKKSKSTSAAEKKTVKGKDVASEPEEEKNAKDLSQTDDTKERRPTKLTCVHCHTKCFSFKQYADHLHTFKHKSILQQINRRQRAYLLRLRGRQRAAQRDIEDASKEDFEPQFCNLCRLHYRLQKAKHQLSEHHRAMKKFLLPYCSVCRLSFKSPMSYEVHRCSIEHLRQKINRGTEDSDSEQEVDTSQIDLNNFLTVDSVGEIDGDLNVDEDDDETWDNEVINEKSEQQSSNNGEQYVKIVKAFYCELCEKFAAEDGDLAKYAAKHCEEQEHQRKLSPKNKDEHNNKAESKTTTETAAKKVEVETAKKEQKIDKIEEKPQQNDVEKATEVVAVVDDESESVEKLWADVDKDIGDIFASVQNANGDEDEEDESVLNIDLVSDMLTNQEKQSKETSSNKKETTDDLKNGDDEKISNDTDKHANEVTNVQIPSKKVKLARSSNSSTKK